MISEKFHKVMCIIRAMLFIETIGGLYILKYISDCIENPTYIINGAIKFYQIPSVFEHILMSVAITVGGAIIFSILEKRGELA